MEKNSIIYALADPRTGEIRYIGKTCRRLRERVASHRSECRRLNHHNARWLRSLYDKGLSPIAVVLAEIPHGQASAKEIEVIGMYKAAGFRLTNLTEGGEGVVGYRHTDEQRSRRKPRQGELSPTHKLKEPQVLEVINLLNEGGSLTLIAKDLGVTWSCIQHIARGTTWKHLTHLLLPMKVRKRRRGKFQGDDHPMAKLTADQVREVRLRLAAGETQASIARAYKVGKHVIQGISSGKSYSSVV